MFLKYVANSWHSRILAVTLAFSVFGPKVASAAIGFVQVNSATPQTNQTTVTVAYTKAQVAGDLNVVVIGWNDSTATIASVTDKGGNVYTRALTPTAISGVATQTIYYAPNIAAAAAGANSVTVTFSTAAKFADIRIAEYSGLSLVSPVDVTVAATGNSTSSSSGAITTTNANDLLVGANLVQTGTTAAGTSFTSRVITPQDADILEDRTVTATGSYSATAPVSPAGQWIMQMVAFKAATTGGTPPTAPGSLTANAVNASQINLSWTASTPGSAALANYLVEQCAGSGCSNFAQIASVSSTTLSYSNAGLTAGTTYNYRVRAIDTSSNFSPYSNTATAATQIPPTAPSSLTAGAVSATQINLSWAASTSTVGLANYIVQRCAGAGCSNFAQIATPAGTTFNDTGLTAGTSYSYRVEAADISGNLSPFSNTATTSTQTPPTAPATLTATATSTTQINLSWTASTSTVGLANYIVQRCQGAGCSNFAQVASFAATTTAYNDTGLTVSTSYSYRVQASDTSGNLSAFSNTATSTTQGPPTAPSNLTAAVTSATQINLSWTASTSSIGLANYLIEQCSGAGCSNFAQIASIPSTSTTYNNTGLTAGTSYSYRVRASDTSNNLSNYSNTATATTQTPPTAPGGATANATSSTQITVSWTASTSTVGLANYLVEQCQGAGCSNFTQIASVPSTGTSYNNTGLTASTSYSYRVRASDTSNNLSSYSNTATATTQTPPTAPSSLTATATSATQINLGWAASTSTVGLANYIVQRCQGVGCSNFAQIATPTGTTFNDTGLTASTSYSYRVEATDTSGNLSSFSNTATTSTQTPPTAPGTLTATAAGTTQINLSWTASTSTVGLANYIVQRCQGAGCSNFAQVASFAATTTTYNDTGLTASTSYSYRVQASDTNGNLSAFSNTATATTQGPPTPPSNLTATASSATQINLSWTASTSSIGLANYLIEQCQGAGCSNFAQIASIPSTSTTYSNTGLTAGTSYSYRVRASDTSNNLSNYSNTATATTQTPPTAPSNATASATSTTQITVTWTASTSTVGLANYIVQRCQGAGCSNFAQIATPAATTFNDTGLTASTSYSYRIQATDTAGNLSASSNTATTSTQTPQPPTAPGSLTATAAGTTQINLSWTASTSNVGLANYIVQRCQGAGCSTFAQVATPTGTTYSDTGLTPGTSYSYQVQAIDTAGTKGPFSNIASATTSSTPTVITFIQVNSATPQTNQTSVTVAYTKAQGAGDLNVVVVGWNDSTSTVASVTDKSGNVYTRALTPTVISGVASQTIYYAPNIAAAAAGANSVTVTFSTAAAFADIRIAEYSGLALVSPVDATIGATGNSTSSSSGALTTTNANDLLVAGNLVQTGTTAAGTGFTSRVISPQDADILEDQTVTATGSYTGTAPVSPAGQWIMQMVAFKGAPPVPPPTAPTNLTATGAGAGQINLSWTASTSSVGIANYIVQRCQGAGCSNFAQIATPTTTTFNDTGLTGGTSYSYRVLAVDSLGSQSGFSNTASATTQAPPTAPSNLTASAVSGTQINLSWTASTSTLGLANYFVQRCQGVGCSNFAQIASFAATVTTYNDTGLTASTSYSYRVQASDTGGNLSAFSNVATATTQGPPSAPSNLTATVTSATQINLSWGASSSSIGLANYLIEQCQGAGCSNFAQIASVSGTTTTYNNTGLTSGTSYSYRVRATDTASNFGPYSNVATGTTQTPPTIPGNATANATSATQITVTWTASTSTVGLANYIVQRCQGAGCSNFAQVATPAGTTFNDTGLTGATSYTYRVQAADTAGNLSGFSNTATATTQTAQPPTAPTNLTATTAGTTQINLSWTASTSNVGLANYIVQRCAGAGCSSFAQVATPTATTYNDTGLLPGTTYRYQVQAIDTQGTPGPFSNIATATTSTTPSTVTFMQVNNAVPQDGMLRVNLPFTAAQNPGDLNIVVVGWNDTTSAVTSVTDTIGNIYTLAVGPTAVGGVVTQSIYYARNIQAATAGANVVTVAWSAPAFHPDIRIAEYAGADPINPIDVVAAATGNSTNSTVGPVTTTNARDLIMAANTVKPATVSAGTGFTSRVITSDGDILEDEMVTTTGSYSAAAPLTPAGQWVMQLLAIRSSVSGGASAPSTPANLTAAAITSTQVDLSWTASNSSVGIASYAVQRCQNSGCTNFAQVGTVASPATTYSDTGLASNLTYRYRVQAFDTANNPSPFSNMVTVAVSTTLGISPRTATMTPTRTQQFTATSANVIWQVDGVNGGSSTSGTITTTGLYTPPSTPGQHTVTVALSNLSQSASAPVYITNYPGTYTRDFDNLRTGLNPNETVLTAANVNSNQFGKLYSYPIDGTADASPLYVPNVTIPGSGPHNVVYVATEHDSLYAFDADGLQNAPLWQLSFINPAAGVTTVPPIDTGECCDISPEIGITGSPVIDPSTNTLYIVVKTKEVSGNNTNYFHRLHALDLGTGAEKFGGPLVLTATYPGNGAGSSGGIIPFNSLHQNQRAALLLSNGVVYIAFGAHGDNSPYHGWILGYNKTTLQQVMVYNASPNDNGLRPGGNGGGEGSGIWMSGDGLATDQTGNLYFPTGNGLFDANTGGIDYGDTFMKVSTSGIVLDYFTPFDQANMNQNDIDLGSGGTLLLPDQPGPNPHLAVTAGKNGTIYLLNRDNLGKYNSSNNNQIVQSVVNEFPNGTKFTGNFKAPVYWNGNLYYSADGDTIKSFAMNNGLMSTAPTSTSSTIFNYPGATLGMSSNGNTTPILWALQRVDLDPNGGGTRGPGALHAFDATSLSVELYNTNQASGGRDQLDFTCKWSAPLVANGRVYISSETQFTIFGLLP